MYFNNKPQKIHLDDRGIFSSDNSFVKIRSYLTSNILDNFFIPDSDLREFFSYYYSQVEKLKLRFADPFPSINLGFC